MERVSPEDMYVACNETATQLNVGGGGEGERGEGEEGGAGRGGQGRGRRRGT
jgi:hypothetical protein